MSKRVSPAGGAPLSVRTRLRDWTQHNSSSQPSRRQGRNTSLSFQVTSSHLQQSRPSRRSSLDTRGSAGTAIVRSKVAGSLLFTGRVHWETQQRSGPGSCRCLRGRRQPPSQQFVLHSHGSVTLFTEATQSAAAAGSYKCLCVREARPALVHTLQSLRSSPPARSLCLFCFTGPRRHL